MNEPVTREVYLTVWMSLQVLFYLVAIPAMLVHLWLMFLIADRLRRK